MNLAENLKEHRNIIFAISIIIIAIIIIYVSSLPQKATDTNDNSDTLKIITENDEVEIRIETARTNEERQRGLMYRESLCDDCGMLFISGVEQVENFWMKNTYISLDIIFINSKMEIVHIVKDTKPNQTEETYSSIYPVRYVLEVNSGFCENFDIELGNEIILNNN